MRTARTYRATCPGRTAFGRIGRRTDRSVRSVRARGVLETIGLVSTASIVHEFGHIVRAKHVGAGVKYVAVGVGPIMAAFEDRDGTLFVLHAFPFGARVVYDDDFESTPGIDRASIFLAGPVANVLAAIFMSTMFLVTHDHIVVDDGASVERVITNGAGSKAGLLEGDVIQSVNGIPIVADEASYALASTEMSDAPELEFTVVRNGEPTRVTIDTGTTNGPSRCRTQTTNPYRGDSVDYRSTWVGR
jgi:membrane-associated protease RseP (regulator of RpoE activity)